MKSTGFITAILPAFLIITGCSNNDSTTEKLNKAVNQAKHGNWQSAAATAEELSTAHPQAVSPMILRALAYEKSGELAKAIDLARKCVNAAPKDFTAHYTLGRLYSLDPKRQADAFAVLEKALTLKPEDTDTLILLSTIGIKRNEPNTDQYLNLLKHKPEFDRSAPLYYMLGLRQAEKRNFDASKRFMMDALSKCGGAKDPSLVYRIALCFDRCKFPAAEVKKFYNLFIRMNGVYKNPADVASARQRLRQL